MPALPYAHPRRVDRPLKAGDRVRFRHNDGTGRVDFGTVEAGPITPIGGGRPFVSVWWDSNLGFERPSLPDVDCLERIGG